MIYPNSPDIRRVPISILAAIAQLCASRRNEKIGMDPDCRIGSEKELGLLLTAGSFAKAIKHFLLSKY